MRGAARHPHHRGPPPDDRRPPFAGSGSSASPCGRHALARSLCAEIGVRCCRRRWPSREGVGEVSEVIAGTFVQRLAGSFLVADHVGVGPHREREPHVASFRSSPSSHDLVAEVDGPEAGMGEGIDEVALVEPRHRAAGIALRKESLEDAAACRFQVTEVNVCEELMLTVDRLEDRHSPTRVATREGTLPRRAPCRSRRSAPSGSSRHRQTHLPTARTPHHQRRARRRSGTAPPREAHPLRHPPRRGARRAHSASSFERQQPSSRPDIEYVHPCAQSCSRDHPIPHSIKHADRCSKLPFVAPSMAAMKQPVGPPVGVSHAHEDCPIQRD
jgi:hypothetical protein